MEFQKAIEGALLATTLVSRTFKVMKARKAGRSILSYGQADLGSIPQQQGSYVHHFKVYNDFGETPAHQMETGKV